MRVKESSRSEVGQNQLRVRFATLLQKLSLVCFGGVILIFNLTFQ